MKRNKIPIRARWRLALAVLRDRVPASTIEDGTIYAARVIAIPLVRSARAKPPTLFPPSIFDEPFPRRMEYTAIVQRPDQGGVIQPIEPHA